MSLPSGLAILDFRRSKTRTKHHIQKENPKSKNHLIICKQLFIY